MKINNLLFLTFFCLTSVLMSAQNGWVPLRINKAICTHPLGGGSNLDPCVDPFNNYGLDVYNDSPAGANVPSTFYVTVSSDFIAQPVTCPIAGSGNSHIYWTLNYEELLCNEITTDGRIEMEYEICILGDYPKSKIEEFFPDNALNGNQFVQKDGKVCATYKMNVCCIPTNTEAPGPSDSPANKSFKGEKIVEFNMSPNPAQNILKLEGVNQYGSIQIFDSSYRSMMSIQNNRENVKNMDLSNFSAGIYYVVLQNSVERKVERFVKL